MQEVSGSTPLCSTTPILKGAKQYSDIFLAPDIEKNMELNNFQRLGVTNNASVGKEFEADAMKFFASQNIILRPNLSVTIGINSVKKPHRFDLGSEAPPILVECKSHTWTQSGNMPSAKLTVWNEAMYYFHAAPDHYRKIMFVLKDTNIKRGLTLAEYYIKTYKHLIPEAVEVWEYCATSKTAERIH